MPQISSTSAASSSCCSHDSEHFPHRYINLDYCMNALCRREDIAMAINLTNNDRTAFTEIVFLDYLFQTIRQKEKQPEKEKQLARDRITRLLSKKSSDQLYQWIINTNLDNILSSSYRIATYSSRNTYPFLHLPFFSQSREKTSMNPSTHPK
jgi:hypothetical protein